MNVELEELIVALWKFIQLHISTCDMSISNIRRSCMAGKPRFISFIFFFSSRRRHTRFDCDWSSDVCSSDLVMPDVYLGTVEPRDRFLLASDGLTGMLEDPQLAELMAADRMPQEQVDDLIKIGRASCRGRGEISVVGVSLKKKKENIEGEGTD